MGWSMSGFQMGRGVVSVTGRMKRSAVDWRG
jgi:hypothetical protein